VSYNPARTWKNAYSLDFTAQTTQNLKTGGDGTKTIDSKSWALTNSANANTIDITNGTGLVIAASNTNVNYTGTTRTCPILTVPITTVFPSCNLFTHMLRLQARILLTNSITNFEFGGLAFEYTSPTSQNFHTLKGFSTTPNRIQAEDSTASATTIRQVSTSSTDDILCIIYRPPWTYMTTSGAFSTTPMNATTARLNGCGQIEQTSVITTASELQIGLYLITINTQGQTDGFQVTFTHLQLDYMEQIPVIGGF
jgi:hypothetical protein